MLRVRTYVRAVRNADASTMVLVDGCRNAREELFVVVGLDQEVDRTFLEARDGYIDIGKAREENDWERITALNHFALQLKTGHDRHSHVKEKAARPSSVVFHQEVSRARIDFCISAFNAKHQGECLSDIVFIVNDSNERVLLFFCCDLLGRVVYGRIHGGAVSP